MFYKIPEGKIYLLTGELKHKRNGTIQVFQYGEYEKLEFSDKDWEVVKFKVYKIIDKKI